MQSSRILILVAVLFVLLSAAGCTTPSSSSPAPAATDGTVPAGAALSPLALTPADLPAGWTQASARAKESSEVGEAAHNAGWQGGYTVTFVNGSAPAGQQDTLVQTITAYPETSMAAITGVAGAQDRSFAGMTYAEIPVSGIGTSGAGFVARVDSTATHQVTTSAALTDIGFTESRKPAGPGQDFAEVYFSKGTTFEVIRMTGPHADADTVLGLAQEAYSKIS